VFIFGKDRQGGFEVLKCCGKPIKTKRFAFDDEDGRKVLKFGYCNNSKCGILVIEIENLTLFGRVAKKTLRGKKALNFLEENEKKLLQIKSCRQRRKNTAKGFHYCNSFWDLKRNLIRMEIRELATDRLIKREEKPLKDVS